MIVIDERHSANTKNLVKEAVEHGGFLNATLFMLGSMFPKEQKISGEVDYLLKSAKDWAIENEFTFEEIEPRKLYRFSNR